MIAVAIAASSALEIMMVLAEVYLLVHVMGCV
jgi:hypothetical protein